MGAPATSRSGIRNALDGMTPRDRLVLTRAGERRGVPGGGNRFLDEMRIKAAAPV